MKDSTLLLWCLIGLIGISSVFCDEYSQKYADSEEVVLFVNKIGPFRNPQEVYKYYILPWCQPKDVVESRFEGLGEALQGYELRQSEIKIYFKRDFKTQDTCTVTLGEQEYKLFKHAIQNQWWYQMFLDDLPIWGMVGEVVPGESSDDDKLYLYTHKKFVIAYNGDQIIEVNLTSENPVLLERGAQIRFTYSVQWVPTDTPFADRFEKYLDYNFFEHQIHWFSIFNSFMMVIFLTGLVSMILVRTLRKDYARYAREEEDEEDRDVGDESGWKQVHGDVFRPPPHLLLFSALIGTGHQIAVLIFVVVFISTFGTPYADRGTLVTYGIVGYALLSFVGGYSGGGFYARNDGKYWIKQMILTSLLFPGLASAIAFVLNFVALGYGSLSAIPISTMIVVILIWLFVCAPLTLVGTIVGRNLAGVSDNPCRINPVPRLIPEKPWYMQPWMYVALGGILPFGSIFIEMYFIFTSFWHYKYYYVYGFMFLVYCILLVVSICITIVATYFLLNSEDYRWHWVAFGSSASTAGYVFLYAVYYFYAKTKMSGFFQTVFYFGYMGMFCLGLAIFCGAVGFLGTSVFVKRIYRNVKID